MSGPWCHRCGPAVCSCQSPSCYASSLGQASGILQGLAIILSGEPWHPVVPPTRPLACASLAAVDYDTRRLAKLGAERQERQRIERKERPKLLSEIRAAAEADVPQVEIVRLTGYTREQVRRICLPDAQREAEDRQRRRRRRKPAEED